MDMDACAGVHEPKHCCMLARTHARGGPHAGLSIVSVPSSSSLLRICWRAREPGYAPRAFITESGRQGRLVVHRIVVRLHESIARRQVTEELTRSMSVPNLSSKSFQLIMSGKEEYAMSLNRRYAAFERYVLATAQGSARGTSGTLLGGVAWDRPRGAISVAFLKEGRSGHGAAASVRTGAIREKLSLATVGSAAC